MLTLDLTPFILIAVVGGALISYFLGCFNGAVIVSKYILHNDVRNHGSGNAGLTNFCRVFGGPLTAVVILTDFLKAVVAVLVVRSLVHLSGMDPQPPLDAYWAGLFCLLGHMFPCMFQFKGGKGILSGGAVLLMIDWRVALVGWAGFVLLFLLTKRVSVGSVWAGASFPFSTWFVFRSPLLLVLAILCGGLIVWKHRGNIQRLLNGTEPRSTFRRQKKEGG